MEITYEKIKNILIKEQVIDEHQIHVEFQAENQSEPLSATAFLQLKEIQAKKNKKRKEKEKIVDKIFWFDENDRREAIVRAFKTLCIFYDYDKKNEKWIFKMP